MQQTLAELHSQRIRSIEVVKSTLKQFDKFLLK